MRHSSPRACRLHGPYRGNGLRPGGRTGQSRRTDGARRHLPPIVRSAEQLQRHRRRAGGRSHPGPLARYPSVCRGGRERAGSPGRSVCCRAARRWTDRLPSGREGPQILHFGPGEGGNHRSRSGRDVAAPRGEGGWRLLRRNRTRRECPTHRDRRDPAPVSVSGSGAAALRKHAGRVSRRPPCR